MNNFIKDYQKSKYYSKLFEVDSDIIIAYLGGSYSFQTSHEDSDYDINVITTDSDFFSVYFDGHLKYKNRTVHGYYRPVADFFKLTCYDLVDYIGVLTLLHIPTENIIYLNPKYEKQGKYLYENRNLILKHICIELGLSSKSFINFILNLGTLDHKYAQRVYFVCLAAYYHLGSTPNFNLLRYLSKLKRKAVEINQEEFQEAKNLLSKFLESLNNFDLKTNRAELRALGNNFSF